MVPYRRFGRIFPLCYGRCFLSCECQGNEGALRKHNALRRLLETFLATRRYLAVIVIFPFL